MTRIIINKSPFGDITHEYWARNGDWPAWWVDHPVRALDIPSVALFRLSFTVGTASTIRIHVTADNRYNLMLDGRQVGCGPERGDPAHWFFETYEITLAPGVHTLTAMNWWLGDCAPQAQMTVRSGFLLAAEGEWGDRLSTGIAPWEASLVSGITLLPAPENVWGTGGRIRIDGNLYPWGWQQGEACNWQPVKLLMPGMSAAVKAQYPVDTWLLTLATLPPMRLEHRKGLGRLRYLVAARDDAYPVQQQRHLAAEATDWSACLAGLGKVTVPPHTTRLAVIDLPEYFCAYPVLRLSGGAGAYVSLKWAEALYENYETHAKGRRDEIEGKTFHGTGDEFLPDGGSDREFMPLWWMSGRYLELTVVTGEDALILDSLGLIETGYPLRWEGNFAGSDDRLAKAIPVGLRTLQMCAHETYMDCPHYEQMMYVGDARLEALTTYVVTRDDRLPRKALSLFDASRLLSGLTRSQYPSRIVQIIPPYALWWVNMVHDSWQWRNDPAFILDLMPGVRGVVEAFYGLVNDDGVLDAPGGWNFIDWVPEWSNGMPPGDSRRACSVLNLQLVLALQHKAELEEFFGQSLSAEGDRAMAVRLMDAVLSRFWCEERGLIADTPDKAHFSEHAQCLAVLTGLLPAHRQTQVIEGLLRDDNLARTTIYFSHYLFDVFYRMGRIDRLFDMLPLWFDLPAQGLKTTFESPDPCRSDCHAWGAHFIYHYYASLLGIRPQGAGFRSVRIAPAPGPLSWIKGILPHPDGDLTVELRQDGERLQAEIILPPGIDGRLIWRNQECELQPGAQVLEI